MQIGMIQKLTKHFSFKYDLHFACTTVVIVNSVLNNKYESLIPISSVTITTTTALQQQLFISHFLNTIFTL